MEMFQVLVGGMFSILGACTILFIVFRAYTIGTEVTEIKELLKDLKRMSALDHPAIPEQSRDVSSWTRSQVELRQACSEGENYPD